MNALPCLHTRNHRIYRIQLSKCHSVSFPYVLLQTLVLKNYLYALPVLEASLVSQRGQAPPLLATDVVSSLRVGERGPGMSTNLPCH